MENRSRMHPLMQTPLIHSVGDASLATSQGWNVIERNPSIGGYCLVPVVPVEVSYWGCGGTGVMSIVMF
jgi:hypothetical protein